MLSFFENRQKKGASIYGEQIEKMFRWVAQMNLIEVKRVLEENFNKEPVEGKKRNIVFWYDEEGEFIEDIDELRFPCTVYSSLQ